MKLIRLLALALTVTVSARADACLTGYSVALLRAQPPADLAAALRAARPTPNPGATERRIKALEESLDRGRSDENELTDLAVLYAETGHLLEAAELLRTAETTCPRFESAASLGSVYERMGDLDKAAIWLRTAAERAPDEELWRLESRHAAAVAIRLEQRDDRRVLERRNFLNLDFGAAEAPVRPQGLDEAPAALLAGLLRLVPEEGQFADLWLVLGELAQLSGQDPALARASYERAAALGHPRGALLRLRHAGLDRVAGQRRLDRWGPVLVGLSLVLGGLVVWRLLRRPALAPPRTPGAPPAPAPPEA